LRRRPRPSSSLFPYTTLFRSYRGITRDQAERLCRGLSSDAGAEYCEVIEIDAGAVRPLIALPGDPGNGRYIGEAVERVRVDIARSEEHTSELQSLRHLVCRLL